MPEVILGYTLGMQMYVGPMYMDDIGNKCVQINGKAISIKRLEIFWEYWKQR